MGQPFLTPSAIILMLMRDRGGKREVLLQRRQNTGFGDGLWDFSCSGKVEAGESMTKTAIREAAEEIGIELSADDLNFAVFLHKCDKSFNLIYYNAYFVCTRFKGEPHICEREKCSELKWFAIDSLPADLLDDRMRALDAYLNGIHYIEYGWE